MSIDFTGGVGAANTPFGGGWLRGGNMYGGNNGIDNGAGINKGGVGFSSFANMLRGQTSQGVANGQGGMKWGGGGGMSANPNGTYGAGGGWGQQQGQLNDLLNRQLALGQQADAKNEANWNSGVNRLDQATNSYNNSAITQGNRSLVQGLQADPYSINAQTQANIQGNAANQINSQNAAAQKQMMGMMAAQGQGSAQDALGMMNTLNRQGNAQQAQTMSQLQVQKALQDKQDVMNAARLGQQQSAQDYGVQMGGAQTFLQNMPQYKAPNLAGFAALIPRMGMQGQAQGQAQGWGGGMPQGQIQQPKIPNWNGGAGKKGNGGDQFSGSMMNGGGPDAYANAAGGGPGAATPDAGYGSFAAGAGSGGDWAQSSGGGWGGGGFGNVTGGQRGSGIYTYDEQGNPSLYSYGQQPGASGYMNS